MVARSTSQRSVMASWTSSLCLFVQLMTLVNLSFAYIHPPADQGGFCDTKVEFPLNEAKVILSRTVAALDVLLGKPPKEKFNERTPSAAWKERKRIANTLTSVFPLTLGDKYTIKEVPEVEKLRNDYQYLLDQFQGKDNLPGWRLCCNDDWAKPIKKFPKTEDQTGTPKYPPETPVSDQIQFFNEDFILWDRWQPDQTKHHYYNPSSFRDPSWTENGRCNPDKTFLGFALDSAKVVTLCPEIFNKKEASLTTFVDQLKGDSNRLDAYYSISIAIIHETTHALLNTVDQEIQLTVPNKVTGVPEEKTFNGYGFVVCNEIAKKRDGVVSNADSYALFAMAMFLSKWDWSSGSAIAV